MVLCPQKSKRRRGVSIVAVLLVLVLLCAGVGGFSYYKYFSGPDTVNESELILRAVSRASFDHIVREQGEIESSSNTDVVCQVKSRSSGGTSILWVVDEGTQVEKGEKLVELDSAQLETELKQQKIVVNNARATLTSAEATLEQARIARQEYLEGVFLTEKKAIESEIAVAQQDLRKAQLNLRSTEKMVAKGLVNALQMEGDQFGVVNAQNQLDAAKGKLRVLEDLTKQKMLVQFDSDIESAVAAREAARSTMSEEEEKLTDFEQQIKACVMYAPASGVVVHANEYSSRGGNAEFVVEPGATVRERQVIIRLPDPNKMQVKAKVNESRITLVREGMPAKIRIDAIEGMELMGQVKKVNRYAEPGNWFSSSTKEYACEVQILNPPDNIRTGMTAEVQIFVEQKKNALQIPIQGIYEHFGETFTLIRTPDGKFETRPIEIGATNNSVATIASGVEEGEMVVLNLRNHLNLMNLPEQEELDEGLLADEMPEREVPPVVADGPSDQSAEPAPGGGGGMPPIGQIVDGMMSRVDTDGDSVISSEELEAVDEEMRTRLSSADTDGDGSITKQEVSAAMQKMMQRMRSGGGPGGPPGGGFGG